MLRSLFARLYKQQQDNNVVRMLEIERLVAEQCRDDIHCFDLRDDLEDDAPEFVAIEDAAGVVLVVDPADDFWDEPLEVEVTCLEERTKHQPDLGRLDGDFDWHAEGGIFDLLAWFSDGEDSRYETN